MDKEQAELNRKQEERARSLAANASIQASDHLGRTLARVLAESLNEVTRESGKTPEQVMNRMNVVRGASQNAIANDILATEAEVIAMMREAISEGYRDQIEGLSKIWSKRGGFDAEAEVTPEDEEALHAWPVQDHQIDQWGAWIAEALRWEIDGLMTAPVVGSIMMNVFDAKVESLRLAHQKRVGQAVDNAYLAGLQAGSREWEAFLIAIGAR